MLVPFTCKIENTIINKAVIPLSIKIFQDTKGQANAVHDSVEMQMQRYYIVVLGCAKNEDAIENMGA